MSEVHQTRTLLETKLKRSLLNVGWPCLLESWVRSVPVLASIQKNGLVRPILMKNLKAAKRSLRWELPKYERENPNVFEQFLEPKIWGMEWKIRSEGGKDKTTQNYIFIQHFFFACFLLASCCSVFICGTWQKNETIYACCSTELRRTMVMGKHHSIQTFIVKKMKTIRGA